MNKFAKLLALGLVCFSPSIFAQSAFQGFYGQIATGYENNSVSNTSLTMNNRSNFPGGNNNPSNGSAPLILGAGYNYSISQNLLLGVGLDYSFLETTIGTANINGSYAGTGTTYKASNRLNIFLAPGYVIDKDKLAYAKVGYSTQKLKASYYDDAGPSACSGNSMGSGNAQGFLAGLGYKQIISGGFYGFTEANYYSYGRTSMGTSTLCDTTLITNFSPSTSAYNFLAGVGYKF
jgi:outer membrane immunogenic protein